MVTYYLSSHSDSLKFQRHTAAALRSFLPSSLSINIACYLYTLQELANLTGKNCPHPQLLYRLHSHREKIMVKGNITLGRKINDIKRNSSSSWEKRKQNSIWIYLRIKINKISNATYQILRIFISVEDSYCSMAGLSLSNLRKQWWAWELEGKPVPSVEVHECWKEESKAIRNPRKCLVEKQLDDISL